MKKIKYQHAKELAQRVLLEQNVFECPINVREICNNYGIVVATYQSVKKTPGCCFIYDGVPMIFIDNRMTKAKQSFVCAHELGHILMGHVGTWWNIEDTSSLPKRLKESVATTFAIELDMHLRNDCV